MRSKTDDNDEFGMKNLKRTSTLRVLVVYCVTASVLCSSSRGSLLGNSFKLQMRNDMGPGKVLEAQCRSNNNESSEQELQPGEAMSMVLADKLFNRSKVGCHFSASGSEKGVSGHFEVFDEGETGYACGEVCQYSVREDGLWMYDFRDAEWEFKAKWL